MCVVSDTDILIAIQFHSLFKCSYWVGGLCKFCSISYDYRVITSGTEWDFEIPHWDG